MVQESTNEKLKQVKLTDTKPIEIPRFDPRPFKGKPATIEEVNEVETQYGYAVQIVSAPVTEFNGKPIRASKLLSLQENNETGEIGWTADSNLSKFLAAFGVKHYNELIGKPITLTVRVDAKNKFTYLDFV